MKKLLFIFIAFIRCAIADAQQNTSYRQGSIASPLVSGNTVTFTLNAPNAQSVSVIGDWEANAGKAVMTKDTGNIWSYTISGLPSDIYTYRFVVDDLTILDPTNTFQKRDVGTLFSLFIINGGKGDYYSVNNVPHGSVTRTWYYSKNYKTNRRMTIYTPPGYEAGKTHYPVLYLLHGSGGDEDAWITLGSVERIMDNLIAQQKAVPMIVVMPNGNPSKQAAPGESPANFDFKPAMSNTFPGYKDGSYESSFTEIMDYIDKHYATKPQKMQRAVAGLSMGGFHALYISANYPNDFDYVGLFSPGINYTGLNMTHPAYEHINEKLLTLKKSGLKLYWIGIGSADPLVTAVKTYRSKLDSLGISYKYIESTRGHLWANWRSYMLEFVPQLFKN